jgi:hypothetical protein
MHTRHAVRTIILANLLIISKSNSVFVSCSAASSLEVKSSRYWMPARKIYSGGGVTKKNGLQDDF